MTGLIVIGAGPGVGAVVARRFTSDGMSVGMIARPPQRTKRRVQSGDLIESLDSFAADGLP